MEKTNKTAWLQASFKKQFLIMKLTLLFTVVFTVRAMAGLDAQSINLKVSNEEISAVLTRVEKQTDFRFLFNSKLNDLKRKVTVSFINASIKEVLDQLFAGTNLTYKELDDKLIALRSTDPVESDIRVTGKVTNETGDALAGVSVLVKGTKQGTITDVYGNFAITVPENAVLLISAVGYESQEVPVAGKQQLTIRLVQSTRKMEEVVVIGYGTASKRDLTGSIVKISGKDVADKPNTNPVASLQGKVPGLYVVNSGTPGAEPDIRIQGTVSIGQVHPLYVIDGIFSDNVDFINPNDIESIEILKDASSLAIFGVKGATGVIAITTKRAKAGQTTINFNTTYGFKTLVDKIKMADTATFNMLFKEENANNGVSTPDYSALTGNSDWIDAVTRTGQFSTSNLTVSGGTDNNKFNFGVGYTVDQGIIRHEQLQKMLATFNDEFKVNKAIKIGVNLNVARIHNPYDATGVLDNARKTMPQISSGTKPFRVKNPYGVDSINANIYSDVDRALQNSGVINPLLELENTWDKTISYTYHYVGNVYADINFLKRFNLRSTWYADVSNTDDRVYNPLYYAYDPLTNTPVLYNNITNTRTQVSETNGDIKKYQQDYILTYKNSFSDHNLTLTAGFTTFYYGTFQRYGLSKEGTGTTDKPIPNDKRFWYLNNGFGYPVALTVPSYQAEYTTASELARALYNYRGKYYFNASFRNDASSQIPSQNRNQQFWAIGAAWEITKEDFMQGQHIVDFLKLKASTGLLGNQSTYGLASFYPSYPGLKSGQQTPFQDAAVLTIATAALPAYTVNPGLRWETVNSTEIGVELNAFKNRLHFEANYFNKVTKDLMTYVDLSSLGLDNKLENGGKIKNWGEEFSATWDQKINTDFSVSVSGNITFLKNKVLSVAEDLPGGQIIEQFTNNGAAKARTYPGDPIGSFYGFEVAGLYQSNLDILLSPPASSLGTYRPGDFKFKDVNGDGVIDANDRKVIGNPSPDFIYGGNITLKYKRWNMGVDLGGVYGNEIFRTWGSLESPFQRVNYAAFKVNRWHGPGTSNWEPIISQADRFNYNGSTYNIEDGSYFRIRNLQVGYDFDPKLLSRAKIKGLRLFANVQNLKTWKHNLGYTAEYGGSATGFGFDFAGGAIPRITTFGLNVTF